MTASQSLDLGKITCSLRGKIVAGSYQTCTITYTAGVAGIDDTGSLKFAMRYPTDAGHPQFDDPHAANYVTAVASNGAYLKLRYDLKDNTRPWGKTIHLKVLQGYLRRADRITLTLGDRSQGSPGWRMQTFAERTFEIKVLVDRYATYVYEELPKSPIFRVVAGEAHRIVAVAPSVVNPGKKFRYRSKLEDQWGNPIGKPKKWTHSGIAEPGVHRLVVCDTETDLSCETNPINVIESAGHGRFWADLHGQTEETIGTNSIDDYFRFARDYGFLDACAHQGNDFQITDEFWGEIQETTKRFDKPGRFVTFPGWEWSGNTGLGGDRNVLFLNEGGVITRSSRALVRERDAVDPCSETVEDLFDRVESCRPNVMLFAHVGGRYADLARHREGLETAVEVHSAWGTFEWMLSDAFERGYRIAIVANSDGHKGRPGASFPGASTFGSYGGLTCILAKSLDRESVWEAYQSRRVYGTTGARILLDVETHDGDQMGSVVPLNGNPPRLHISIHGTAAIERVEIRNAMRVLKTIRPQPQGQLGSRLKLLWQGATVRGRGRQVEWDGDLSLTGNRIRSFETVNFHNPEKTCELFGSKGLRWQSTTTGGVAGVILELRKPSLGELSVTTVQKSFTIDVAGLRAAGKSFRLGGVGKKISVYPLGASNGCRDLSLDYSPRLSDMQSGDNPLYVCVVQEDGHMAWSSPIYVVNT